MKITVKMNFEPMKANSCPDQRSLGEYHVTRWLSHCLPSRGNRHSYWSAFYGCQNITTFTLQSFKGGFPLPRKLCVGYACEFDWLYVRI